MSLKWTGSVSDSGILRKSEFKEKKEELFVFGYSCKLFRDDEKALHIDQGKHLIPWMGDETLKIDRFDLFFTITVTLKTIKRLQYNGKYLMLEDLRFSQRIFEALRAKILRRAAAASHYVMVTLLGGMYNLNRYHCVCKLSLITTI